LTQARAQDKYSPKKLTFFWSDSCTRKELYSQKGGDGERVGAEKESPWWPWVAGGVPALAPFCRQRVRKSHSTVILAAQDFSNSSNRHALVNKTAWNKASSKKKCFGILLEE
jgi:hypothetical protein